MTNRRTAARTPRRSRPSHNAAALVLTFIIAGCAETRGPELVVNSHIEYNKAVSQVLKEELLLNVVRRRYMEALQFVSVSSISSNFSTSMSVGADGSVADLGDANIFGSSIDASVSFSDSPTITITPRQGEDIAKQLHGPLSVSAVADLVTAGYPVPDVLNMLVEGINNLRGPDLRYDLFRPGSSDWLEAISLIDKFYDEGSLIVDRFRWNDPYNSHAYPAESITPEMWITTLSTGARRWKSYDGGETFFFTTHEMAPAIWLDTDVRESPDGQRLLNLLNVQSDVQKKIWVMESARVVDGADLADRPDNPRPTLKFRMRSLYNVLNFYSYGVHVPPVDERDGRATDLSSFREAVASGEIDNYSQRLAIRYSRQAPESAFLVVRHRRLWFYIDDRDLTSKEGFNALFDLWQLSIKAPSSRGAPVTTIQVN
ncbi:MAG: hypothetical protein V3T53_03175 [Phycisphaerales bacterium]